MKEIAAITAAYGVDGKGRQVGAVATAVDLGEDWYEKGWRGGQFVARITSLRDGKKFGAYHHGKVYGTAAEAIEGAKRSLAQSQARFNRLATKALTA